MSSGVETSLILLKVSAPVKNSQRFLDFARNDKNGDINGFVGLML
jgi:hypothetical protein